MHRLISVFLIALMSSGLAFAEDDKLAKARAIFSDGETYYRLGDFAAAMKKYHTALELVPRPSLLFNIAQCYRQLRKLERAIFYYKLYLADWKRLSPDRPPLYEEEIQGHIQVLTATLAKERERAQAPASGPVPQQKKPAPAPGRLRLLGIRVADARISVDGELREITPVHKPIEVKPGQRKVEVQVEGYLRWNQPVLVQPGEETLLEVILEPLPQHKRNGLWLATSIGCVVLAGGAEAVALFFTAKGNAHYRDTPPFYADRKVAIAGHVGAGVLGALAFTSAILYWSSGKRERHAAPSGAIVALPGGVAATARFTY